MKCQNEKCGQVYITVAGVNDHNPTCKYCGGTKFRQVSEGTKEFMPMFCNWRKQREIRKAAYILVEHTIHQCLKDYGKDQVFSEKELEDLIQNTAMITIQALTSNRDRFQADQVIRYILGKRKLKTN